MAKNRAPIAKLIGPTEAIVGQTVLYDGSQSSDDRGPIKAWRLTSSDGVEHASGQGHPPSAIPVTFDEAGMLDLVLEVQDATKAKSTALLTVDVSAPAPLPDPEPIPEPQPEPIPEPEPEPEPEPPPPPPPPPPVDGLLWPSHWSGLPQWGEVGKGAAPPAGWLDGTGYPQRRAFAEAQWHDAAAGDLDDARHEHIGAAMPEEVSGVFQIDIRLLAFRWDNAWLEGVVTLKFGESGEPVRYMMPAPVSENVPGLLRVPLTEHLHTVYVPALIDASQMTDGEKLLVIEADIMRADGVHHIINIKHPIRVANLPLAPSAWGTGTINANGWQTEFVPKPEGGTEEISPFGYLEANVIGWDPDDTTTPFGVLRFIDDPWDGWRLRSSGNHPLRAMVTLNPNLHRHDVVQPDGSLGPDYGRILVPETELTSSKQTLRVPRPTDLKVGDRVLFRIADVKAPLDSRLTAPNGAAATLIVLTIGAAKPTTQTPEPGPAPEPGPEPAPTPESEPTPTAQERRSTIEGAFTHQRVVGSTCIVAIAADLPVAAAGVFDVPLVVTVTGCVGGAYLGLSKVNLQGGDGTLVSGFVPRQVPIVEPVQVIPETVRLDTRGIVTDGIKMFEVDAHVAFAEWRQGIQLQADIRIENGGRDISNDGGGDMNAKGFIVFPDDTIPFGHLATRLLRWNPLTNEPWDVKRFVDDPWPYYVLRGGGKDGRAVTAAAFVNAGSVLAETPLPASKTSVQADPGVLGVGDRFTATTTDHQDGYSFGSATTSLTVSIGAAQ